VFEGIRGHGNEQSSMQNSNAFEYVPESTPDFDEKGELRERAWHLSAVTDCPPIGVGIGGYADALSIQHNKTFE
jgi:hypothetical protein